MQVTIRLDGKADTLPHDYGTAALGASAMKNILLVITVLSISSCSQENTVSVIDNHSGDSRVMIEAADVHTYDQLRSYLDQRYGDIEELPVTAILTSGMDTSVPFKYLLQDGREVTIPIIFTASNQRIVDPEFDLESLPD